MALTYRLSMRCVTWSPAWYDVIQMTFELTITTLQCPVCACYSNKLTMSFPDDTLSWSVLCCSLIRWFSSSWIAMNSSFASSWSVYVDADDRGCASSISLNIAFKHGVDSDIRRSHNESHLDKQKAVYPSDHRHLYCCTFLQQWQGC